MIAGGIALVNYGERGPIWHSRALLAHAGASDWAVLTPDLDVYIETLAGDNPDFTDFYYCGESGAIPAHIDPNHVYSFDPMTPQELGAFRVQGQVLADAQLRAQGAPGGHVAGPGVPAAGAPAPVGPAAAAGPVGVAPPAAAEPVDSWIALEEIGAYKRGDLIARDPQPLPGGALVIGLKGVLPVGVDSLLIKKVKASEAASYKLEDLRVLPVKFDNQGIRRQEFPAAVALMDDSDPSGGGLQLTGPKTALALMKDCRDQAFTAGTFHEHWLRVSDIPRGDRSIYEHEVLSRILDSMVTVDQLNVPALQSAELICRRLQVIREAHRISPGQPDYSAADLFMGWRFRKSGQGINSQLAQHVANELKAEAAIAKEARKAKEEQAARRKGRAQKGKAADGGGDA